jgi:hypothetical protein
MNRTDRVLQLRTVYVLLTDGDILLDREGGITTM